jgi:hypothetical protein
LSYVKRQEARSSYQYRLAYPGDGHENLERRRQARRRCEGKLPPERGQRHPICPVALDRQPGDAVLDRLVAAIEALADRESDADRKSKLRSAAAVVGGMARDVIAAVLSQKLGTTL